MDIERALVSKIVSTGQLQDAIAKGVRVDLFSDEECAEVFDHIVGHARRYGSPPSLKALQHDREQFEVELVQEPLDYIIDKFIVMAKRKFAQDMVEELALITNDPEKGQDIDLHFLEVSRKLATLVPSSEVHRFVGDMEQRIAEQEEMQKQGKQPGIPFGYPTLDAKTGGMLPHEFITVAGFSGFGKSTFLKSVGFNVWAGGYTPLIITLEEEKKEIAKQFDAMAASLDLTKIRQLGLAPDDFKRWRELKERLKDSAADIPIIDNLRHATPDAVFAETVRYKPDVVILDYLTLMRSGRPTHRSASMWQTITEITQDLKQNARTLGIPILAAAQTNREGGKDGAELGNIGNSISIIQDSDKVIGLFADDQMKERQEMELRLIKNRRGALCKVKAIWNHDEQIFREKILNDMFKRGEEA
jgi:replicative DNA helicase